MGLGGKMNHQNEASKPTKRNQILSFYQTGIKDIQKLAQLAHTKPSYVASILQDAGLVTGYFDLYTSSGLSMNVYSKYFANRLGYKSEKKAKSSVRHIERTYKHFKSQGDRAGQHHTLATALLLFNRARWTNKKIEAEPFRRWLIEKLEEVE
jgi:hypothetical protein